MSNDATLEVIEDYAKTWFRYHQHRRWAHHAASFIGVGASGASAALSQELPQLAVNGLGVIALIALSFVMFFRPLERARCYVEAWRHLHTQLLLYREGRLSAEDLIAAYREGEERISVCD